MVCESESLWRRAALGQREWHRGGESTKPPPYLPSRLCRPTFAPSHSGLALTALQETPLSSNSKLTSSTKVRFSRTSFCVSAPCEGVKRYDSLSQPIIRHPLARTPAAAARSPMLDPASPHTQAAGVSCGFSAPASAPTASMSLGISTSGAGWLNSDRSRPRTWWCTTATSHSSPLASSSTGRRPASRRSRRS